MHGMIPKMYFKFHISMRNSFGLNFSLPEGQAEKVRDRLLNPPPADETGYVRVEGAWVGQPTVRQSEFNIKPGHIVTLQVQPDPELSQILAENRQQFGDFGPMG